MSSSMWAWRVIVPGLGLAASLLVLGLTYAGKAPWTGGAEKPVVRVGAGPRARVRIIAEGRVAARPGAEVIVGTELGGTITALSAREKAKVHKGDLLVTFRSDEQQTALAEAEARLAEADAELAYQRREYERRAPGAARDAKLSSEQDAVRRDYEVSTARRRVALATTTRCRALLERTRVVAPLDGVVLATFAQPGETVSPGARLVTVCDLSRVRIEAEVDEFDAARVAPGDNVTITAEGFGAASWPGTVEEVPDRVADRSVRPEDPGRPSDTRVLLVKIAPVLPMPLKLGQQVEVEIRSKR